MQACTLWAKCGQRVVSETTIFSSPLTRKKKDVRQSGGSLGSGASGGQGESQSPIETIIQLVMTQQMIEAQKVR